MITKTRLLKLERKRGSGNRIRYLANPTAEEISAARKEFDRAGVQGILYIANVGRGRE